MIDKHLEAWTRIFFPDQGLREMQVHETTQS